MASEQEMLRVVFSADETGHSMGYHTIATALRDAGIEVILAGPQIPREIAYTAIQEGADVIDREGGSATSDFTSNITQIIVNPKVLGLITIFGIAIFAVALLTAKEQ